MRSTWLILIAAAIPLVGAAPSPTPVPTYPGLRALASPAGPESGEPNLVTAPDGRVWLTWFERRDENTHRLRASALDGAKWSKPVTIAELTAAAEVWSRRRTRPSTSPKSIRLAKTQFVSIGSDWLRTLGRLQETRPVVPFASELDAFLRYLQEERGLAETTVIYRRRSLRLFFLWL